MTASINAETTLDSYNQHVVNYVAKDSKDIDRTVAYWPGIEMFLGELAAGETIFEIGSGTGADALRIEELGFEVIRSDASEGFLEYLRTQGFVTSFYDVLSGPTPKLLPAIFANAVLLHFDVDSLRHALANIHNSLSAAGLFCFTYKIGGFEGWRENELYGKRYFKLWQTEDIVIELLQQGFKIKHNFIASDGGLGVITVEKVAS